MSASDHAVPLYEENAESKTAGLSDFKCLGCGYKGKAGELLCVKEEDTLWCPICRTSGWVWK